MRGGVREFAEPEEESAVHQLRNDGLLCPGADLHFGVMVHLVSSGSLPEVGKSDQSNDDDSNELEG